MENDKEREYCRNSCSINLNGVENMRIYMYIYIYLKKYEIREKRLKLLEMKNIKSICYYYFLNFFMDE